MYIQKKNKNIHCNFSSTVPCEASRDKKFYKDMLNMLLFSLIFLGTYNQAERLLLSLKS